MLRTHRNFWIAVICLYGCTHGNSEKKNAPREPVSAQKNTGEVAPPPRAIPPPEAASSDCIVLGTGDEKLPIFMQAPGGGGAVVTRFTAPCVTSDGLRGFAANSSWMAMGVPCNGGGGRVDWKGLLGNPHMIMFNIATDCPMLPSGPADLKIMAATRLRIPDGAPLIAYNPLNIQYWELTGFPDAGTGYQIELRSTESLRDGWPKFIEGEPFHVEFYGRENAWVNQDQLYHVSADLIYVKPKAFRLSVKKIEAIGSEEILIVRGVIVS